MNPKYFVCKDCRTIREFEDSVMVQTVKFGNFFKCKECAEEFLNSRGQENKTQETINAK